MFSGHSTCMWTGNVDFIIISYRISIHVLMRDEKEERKKQARSNKHKAKQHSTHV